MRWRKDLADQYGYTRPVMGSIRLFLLPLGAALLSGLGAGAQARPTADRTLHPSAFVLFSGTYTGLGASPLSPNPGLGGRNFTLTLGGDLGVLPFRRFDLAAEVRGSYPLNKGKVDSQKSILGGLRVSREPVGEGFFSRVRPYANVLVGRGAMDYRGSGYPVPGLLYTRTVSTVYDAGGGFEVDITQQFSLKGDAQFQRWSTPVTASGHVYASQGGVGLVYRYGAGGSPR